MSKKPTTQEIGVLLQAVGSVMEHQGVVAGVLVGPDRDKASDADVYDAAVEIDEDMTEDRVEELLDMDFSDLEGAGA